MRSRKLGISIAAGACLLVGGGWLAFKYQKAGGSMTRAAADFLAALTDEQREAAKMPFDDPARLDWHFIPKDKRKGLQIKQMQPDQRQAAHALFKTALSEAGYSKTTTIMALESILHELEKERRGGAIRDPERYYFTVFGAPEESGTWGLSVEGHHLSLNFVVEKGQLVATTPTFLGANPGEVRNEVAGSPPKGTRTLAQEEDLAFKLLASLDEAQRKQAIIAEKAPSDIRGAAEPQPPSGEPEGIAAGKLSAEQSRLLRELIAVYAAVMPPEVADARLAGLEEAGFAAVHFAWAGASKPGVGHYYRVQGPTFVIELCNTQPDSAGNPANHVHCVWRDLRGDFGVRK